MTKTIVSISKENVLAIRDALVADDLDEAYHQLYTAFEWPDPCLPWVWQDDLDAIRILQAAMKSEGPK